jgi:hypothetical protein
MNWNIEPYQEEVNKIECKHCGERSTYDFCSDGCRGAYWSEMD